MSYTLFLFLEMCIRDRYYAIEDFLNDSILNDIEKLYRQ